MSRSRLIRLDQAQQFLAINVLTDPGHDPAARTIPNCMRVVLNWTLTDGKTAHVVTHARYVGTFPGTQGMANALHTGLSTGTAYTTLAGSMNPTGSFSGVSLRDVNTVDQPIISSTTPGAPGTGAGSSLPDEVAAVVTLRTVDVGPGNRGRMYIPNWSVAAMGAGNVIAAATVTALQTWANTFPSTYNAQSLTFVLGLPHRLAYTGSTGRPHAERLATSKTITSITVRDNHWDSQRKRGLK